MDIDIVHKLPLFVSETLLADYARTIVLLLLTFLASQCLACSAFAPLRVACGNVQGSSRSLYLGIALACQPETCFYQMYQRRC